VKESYGVRLPGLELDDLVGKLIVLEGTDGVGRSTQIRLLKEWLEQQGHAVLDTGLTRSGLVGKGIKRAKEGHTLGRITLSLFYTTDFADRLENEIIPALRAGFVVLTDAHLARRVPTVFVAEGEAVMTVLLGNLEHFINHKYQLFFYLKLLGVGVTTSDLYKLT